MATFVLIHGAYQGGWIWQRVGNGSRGGTYRVCADARWLR